MAAESQALWIMVHDAELALEELNAYERRLGEHGELWIDHPGYPVVGTLFSGTRAFMTYLRFEGDAGFTTRSRSLSDRRDAPLTFVLGNGQVDEYPASWTYPKEMVFAALSRFIRTKRVPDLGWHNDSGDGEQLPTDPVA